MRSIAIVAALLLLSRRQPLPRTPAPRRRRPAAPPRRRADAAPPPAADAAPPRRRNPPMTGPQILISTSMGDITLQLDSVRAPKSVANVLRYVKEKHYDGTVFYRVVKGFVIQMGSWDANGKGRARPCRPVAAGSQ